MVQPLSEFAAGKPTGSLSPEEYKIAKALFELSGLHLSDVQSESNYEAFKAQLEATSNSITDEMFEYWTTNKNLEIRFDIEHATNDIRYLNIRIYNSKHRVTLPLKNRSKGFLWFFSFLVWFSKIQGDKNSKYILLLDEPGLSLHASAQNDLLRFIDEKLAPEYQIIYTTHSPFMIDSLKLNSAEEMVKIAELEAKKRGFSIGAEAYEKVATICSAAALHPNMGNERFCRNLIENAILGYASRIYGNDGGEADKNSTLAAIDFPYPQGLHDTKKFLIGFHAGRSA